MFLFSGTCSKQVVVSHLHPRGAGIRSVITGNRLSRLYKFSHFKENQTAAPREGERYDKLHKVRPLLEMTDNTFRSRYKPQMNQTIDEAMVKYKGRFSIKQYMPGTLS
jgi:hypothetical protein